MPGLLLLLTPAVLAHPPPLPQPAVGIPMHEVHAALDGRAPAPDPRVLEPPPQLLERPSQPPPPAPDKQLYGGRMDNHVDSANFTVAWTDGDATQAVAEQASAAMEAAWQALVEEQGWQPPVSSDRYMLWVLLEPDLSGTGLTTEYTSADFPQGYPVIFLNPAYANHSDFFDSLSAHEFAHALQYRLRDWDGTDTDSWYWEASAEWMSEQARPELNVYAWSVYYYSTQPWFRFDSTENEHQYGMSVVNAYIEEALSDEDGLREVWELSEQRTGQPWDAILAEYLGVPATDIWGGFTGAMGNEALRESALYEPVLIDGYATDGLEGEVAMLGTDYFELREDATVSVEAVVDGEVVLISGPDGWGDSLQLGGGDVLGVIGATEPTAGYRLIVVEDSPDTGDDGPADNPGGGLGGQRGGCGCDTSGGAALWLGWLGLGWLRVRRREARVRRKERSSR
jgi:hypothetical protein